MTFTVLQPAMFLSQLDPLVHSAERDGVITGPYSTTARMAYVDYRDVAEAAALSFTTDRFVDGTFELAAAGMFSRVDLAATLSDALGRPVRAERSRSDLPESMPEPTRSGLRAMFDHYDQFGFHGGNSVVLAAMLGREPTGVADYGRRAVAAG